MTDKTPHRKLTLEELRTLRDAEHVETEALDLLEDGGKLLTPYMEQQLERLANRAGETKRADHWLLYNCLWLGWERINRLTGDRNDSDTSETPPQ